MRIEDAAIEMANLARRIDSLTQQLSEAAEEHRVNCLNPELEELLRVKVHVLVDELLDTNHRATTIAHNFGVM